MNTHSSVEKIRRGQQTGYQDSYDIPHAALLLVSCFVTITVRLTQKYTSFAQKSRTDWIDKLLPLAPTLEWEGANDNWTTDIRADTGFREYIAWDEYILRPKPQHYIIHYDKLSSTMLKTTFWKLLCPCRAHTTFPFLISERRKKVSIKIEKKHNPKARTPKTQNGASTDVNDTIRIHATDTLHTVSI